MSSPIPVPILKSVLQKVAKEALPAIASELAALGFDLGPITPDARADFGAVDAEIDKQLAAAAKSDADELALRRPKPTPVHDTDPAMPAVTPPPKPSER